MEIKTKLVNGISYNIATDPNVIKVLEQCKHDHTRILLDYGDAKTNTSWNETYDITGYIGKSTGIQPILILLHNSRSTGGTSILTHCIISIKESKGKRVLYSL